MILLIGVAVLAPLFRLMIPLAITTSYLSPNANNLFGTRQFRARRNESSLLWSALFADYWSACHCLCSYSWSSYWCNCCGIALLVSEIIMRVVDIFMSVPGIALAAVFVSILGQSMFGIIIAIGILYVPQITEWFGQILLASMVKIMCVL